MRRTLIAAVAVALAVLTAAPSPSAPVRRFPREAPFHVRPFVPEIRGQWAGNAVAYGPHRDGQYPGGPGPTRRQLDEDLHLMLRHWHLLRLYGAVPPADSILDIIAREKLDMRVLLGIWVQAEDRRDSTGRVLERFPAAAAANRREIETGLALAARYPRQVVALCVGNETQVFWSFNKVPTARLVATVREVRARSGLPVTVADDFNWWNKPESRALAGELDFLLVHAHPLYNGCQLGDALGWTRARLDEVRAVQPDRPLVLGETGWATQHNDEGDQGRLMKGSVGESEQGRFFAELRAWADSSRVPAFWFEAFDENWKGGARADDAEKHWGVFRADRSPKQAVAPSR